MLRWLRTNPALQKSALDDILLVLLDCDWRRIDPQHARCFAWRGTNAPGELGKVVGCVQLAHGIFPAPAVNQIVPVRYQIADWAAGLAERDTAIHASRALFSKLFLGEILIDLEPVVHTFKHR